MRQRVEVHRQGGPPEELLLDRPASAGGSHADPVHLPGLPPGALRLEPGPAGLVVVAEAVGVRVAGHPVPPGGRRLLRAGERAELHGAAIVLLGGPAPEATRIAAAGLLAEAAAGAPPLAGPHLVVLTGPAAGLRFPLGAEETVGRGRAATLRLPDAQASRRHARIRLTGGAATVEDPFALPAPGPDAAAAGANASPGAGDAAKSPGRRRHRTHAAAAALLALAAALLLAAS